MGDTANIIVGPATISVEGTDLGFTKDGIKLRMERETVDVAADQVKGLVKKVKSLEKFMVSTTLLETTLENIAIAWDQIGPGSFGGNETQEVAVVVVGPAPGGATRTFTMTRAVSVGESEVTYSREEESALTVEFECLKNNDGTFGTIVEA